MRAILIDPFTETIVEVEFDGNYKSIYPLIDCETFDCVSVDKNDTLYVDDEGLLAEQHVDLLELVEAA